MELYNKVNGLENLKVINTDGGSFYPDKISEVNLNSLGYYKVFREATERNERYNKYTPTQALVGKVYTISYTQEEKTVADIQALMIADLMFIANEKFNQATVGYTAGEMAGWRELEDEAKSHATTPLTSGMLFDEATYSEITVDSLVAKVLANAVAFKQMKSYISGTRKRKSTEIMGLIDVNSCIAYENFAYNYTITAEDVAADNTLTLGEVVPRTGNKVTDWTI